MRQSLGRREWVMPLQVFLLAAVYYVSAQLSLRLSLVDNNVTPFWPPTGIAVVALFLFGRRLWPGVAIGALLVNLPITPAAWAAVTTAAGNTITPVIATMLLTRLGFRPALDRLRDALVIVFPAALLSTMVSATIGAATLVASGAVAGGDFLPAWSVWWAGDAMGILVVAPFLFTLPSVAAYARRGPATWIEALALFVALVVVSILAFGSRYSLLFAILPLLGWAAWRFQQAGAAPAALLVTIAATWAAVDERGPFMGQTLLERMLVLQAFNASVACTSFVFAALVTERERGKDALQEAADELEDRVRRRTLELSEANRQLAEAQEVARIGSWEWDVRSEGVRWSDELYQIHGYPPQAFPMTLARATELVDPSDSARIQKNVERAFASGTSAVRDIEYRITRPDGSVRTLLGTGRLTLDEAGVPVRMVGTVQDVTELRELEREHTIAQTLQEALAPLELPVIPGLDLAAHYRPAEEGSSAGGDWYDVIPLPDGSVAIVMGDVAGHGLNATSMMGQARTCVRAYALEGLEPAAVVERAHRFLRQLYRGEQMVTLLFLVIDVDRRTMQMVSAGHPPPVIRAPHGRARYLDTKPTMPLGVDFEVRQRASRIVIEPGSVIVLYTDGLIDRRDAPIEDAFDRLLLVVDDGDDDVAALSDSVIEAFADETGEDDVAVLAVGVAALHSDRLAMRIDADPSSIASVRMSLTRWLAGEHVANDVVDDVVLACSEACSNAVEHAYGLGHGSIDVHAELVDGNVVVAVHDSGRWRPARGKWRGRGMKVIEGCTDDYSVEQDETGTVITMRRKVRGSAPV